MSNLIANDPRFQKVVAAQVQRELRGFQGGNVAFDTSGTFWKNVKMLRSTIEYAMKELDLSGISQAQKEGLLQSLEAAFRGDVKDLLVQEQARVAADMEKRRRTWERDAELHQAKYSAQVEAYRRRLAALNQEELAEEANLVLSQAKSLRPEELDALSSALRAGQDLPKDPIRDPARPLPDLGLAFHDVRRAVSERRLYEPWRSGSPEAEQLSRYDDAVERAIKDEGQTLPVILSDGNVSLLNASGIDSAGVL